jgi:hypothetical protein
VFLIGHLFEVEIEAGSNIDLCQALVNPLLPRIGGVLHWISGDYFADKHNTPQKSRLGSGNGIQATPSAAIVCVDPLSASFVVLH